MTDASESANEHAHISPYSYHGAGKAAAKYFIAACCAKHSVSATLLRPFNYGPGQTERTGFAVIPTGFGKILHNRALAVWGDGSAIRDYLYVDDFVTLCWAVFTAPMTTGAHTSNASSGIGVNLNELFSDMEVNSRQHVACATTKSAAQWMPNAW